MDEPRLSERERRILAEIEQDLGQDVSFERGLRTMGRRRKGTGAPGRPGRRRGPVLVVVLLGVLTLGLLALAVATGEPALVWAFAAAWVLTLACLMRLVVRWSRHLKAKSWPT